MFWKLLERPKLERNVPEGSGMLLKASRTLEKVRTKFLTFGSFWNVSDWNGTF